MKAYGKGVKDTFEFAQELIVCCADFERVQMSTGNGHASFLTIQDVEDLIEQLSEWVFHHKKGFAS